MTNVQASMCPEDDVSQEHCTVDDYKQEELARACIYQCAEVIMELYDSARERNAKQIVGLLHAENHELNFIRETQKDVSPCLLFVCKIGNESLKKGFRILTLSIEGATGTTVPKV